MKIFKQEIEDGLGEKIQASNSVSYASLAQPHLSDVSKICRLNSLASLNDDDLYYVQSILVTSSWNKNDDIFDKAEVWLAKNSPEHKPTNLEHDEKIIIGHITSNWPIDDEGNKLDPDSDISLLPDKYHIVTGSVIYRGYTNPDLKERSEQLIKEIENGTKFVSMECFFKGFDYGLLNNSNGKYIILPRNEKTSHLTKFLRAYGGAGEHENYKIGRVLRKITFSGKGFVDKPANPDSIIFSRSCLCDKKNDSFQELGVLLDKSTCLPETNVMNLEKDNNIVAEETIASESVVESPVTEVVAEETVVETAEPSSTDHDTEAAMPLDSTMYKKEDEDKMMKMMEEKAMKMAEEKAMKMMEEKAMKMAEEAALMKAEYESKWKASVAELEQVKAELVSAKETIKSYKDKEIEAVKAEQKNKRIAALTNIGVANDLAVATVEKLEHVDDSTFEMLTSVFASNKNKEDIVEETSAAVAEPVTDTEILDNVETDDTVDLSIGSETVSSVQETTRAELLDFVCARLGKKFNKGE